MEREMPPTEADPLERITTRDEGDDVEKGMPAGVFGYQAGKSILAKRLIGLFPTSIYVYGEPFCGSAAMFFTKAASPVEMLNDYSDEVMHVYRFMQKAKPADLERLAGKNWKGSIDYFKKVRASATPTDTIDRVHRFLYLNHFTFGKGQKGSYRHDAEGRVCKVVDRIAKLQSRLQHTDLMCGDYEKAIRKYDGPDTFFFLDPPYVGTDSWGKGVGEKEFDETRFRKVLDGIRGKFLLTYGTTGKLDVSGFELKRMRQPDQVSRMHGGTRKFLTHLLVSNFKLTSKSLGDGIEIDDVVKIVDIDDQGKRSVMRGNDTRKWENPDDLLAYPAEPGPVQGDLRLRFLDKRWELDFVAPINDGTIGWTLDVQRAELAQSPALVAKSFSVEGSRYFLPLTKGVAASETPLEALATAVAALDAPLVEFGLQTPTSHEYFLSKGGEVAGQLTLGRDADRFPPLFDKHPWLATYIDSKFIPNAVLKGAPMPPDGVSALPVALEKVIPSEFRYWERTGDEARKSRDALVASGFFDRTSVAVVDGELAPVVAAHKILAPEAPVEPAADWPIIKALSLVGSRALVEVFSPHMLEKAGDRVVFIDAGTVSAGSVALLVKSLVARAEDYIVTAFDSGGAREALKALGRPFYFRPGDGVPTDAVKRVFVTSLGVRGDDILWVDKNDSLDGAPNTGDPDDPHNKLRQYNEPSDDTGDLGKRLEPGHRVLADILKAGADAPRKLLESIGPPNEWSGGVAMAIGPENRKALTAAWGKLSPTEKEAVEAKFHENFSVGKAVWSTAYVNDLNDSAFLYIEPGGTRDEEGKTKPRDLRHFPYRDQDGEVDELHLRNAVAQAPKSNLPASVIESVQSRGRKLLVRYTSAKAEFNNPDPGGPGDLKPRKQKADFVTGAPGTLQPAVQWDVAGSPKVRERDHERDEAEKRELRIVKADDNDEHYVLGIVLEPDVVDAQKDIYSADEVRDAAHKYMAEFQNRGLMHKEIVNGKVDLLESYLSPADFTLGDQHVKKGTWVMAVRVKDAKLWQACKGGELTGFSIGGSANRKPDPKADRKYAARKEAAEKKIAFQGIPIHVDRPKGTKQAGVDDKGTPWERTYKVDYGFIPATKGGDGEGLDVFLGPNNNSPFAYWVTQRKADGDFDEFKLVLGCDTQAEAKKIYLDHVPEKFFAGIREGTVSQIKSLLNQEPAESLAKAVQDMLDRG